MPTLRIRLLGEFELHADERALESPATTKACSLLAYLITHRNRAWPREVLADLFWPERPTSRALRNLSTALWHIHRILPSDLYVLADVPTLQFNPDSDYWLDADEFLLKCQASAPEAEAENWPLVAASLRDAIALYRGGFLEGFYDDWCLEERYRLEALYLEALERLAAACQALQQPEKALQYAKLVLANDPSREDVHRTVIRLHVQMGNRAEAVRQARWCRSALWSELGVELQPETAALCDELLGAGWRRVSGDDAPPPDQVVRRPPLGGGPDQLLDSPAFLGREDEWETLLGRWERARSGQGNVVLLTGEAGIGKTRLAEELSRHVRRRGHWAFYARCYEHEQALQHGLLADVLQAILSATDPSVLDPLPVWQLAELARVAPELEERFPSPLDLSLPTEQRQIRLFDALTRFLLGLARQSPLLLVLEDLQWVNDSALAWFHYLVRHLTQAPILLLATYRPEETGPERALHDLLTQLVLDGSVRQLELGRLSREALAIWMTGASGTLVSRIYDRTDGNPFFMLETLRTLVEEGTVCLTGGRWVEATPLVSVPIPRSVSHLIQARVRRLPAPARQVTAVAAVIGYAFDFDVLEQAWGQGEEATLEALDQLLRNRLIREGESALQKDYEFSHHLVQEIVYRDLHYRRRRRLHRLVGEAIESTCADVPGLAGEVAFRFEQAHETERALTWLVEAGRQAKQNHAGREAMGYFRRALALMSPERADALAIRVLTGLAVAHRDTEGETELAWEWLERALSISEALGDQTGIAEACYALAYRHVDFDRARAQIRRGLEAVQGVEHLESMAVRGYGLLARFYEHEGDFPNAAIWAWRQRDLSERIGDSKELARACHRLGSLLLRVGGPMGEAVAQEQQAARLAEELGWLDFAAGSHNISGHCLLALGRTAEAEAAAGVALRLSTDLEIRWRQCWAYHCLARVASRRGEWGEAERLLDLAEERMAHSPTRFQEIAILRCQGEVAARRGDWDAARLLLETALEMSQRSYRRYVSMLELELAAVSLDKGDGRSARRWLKQARAHIEQSGMASALALADRLRGQLAVLSDDRQGAEDAFADSLHRWEGLEQAVEAAHTRLAWGQGLRLHSTVRARALIESALDTFTVAEAWPEVATTRRLLE
jgi:DNA-binding SARP family transcriptional activator